MLQHAQIIHAQRIMFVKDNQGMTKELRKNKLSESGFEEEWEIQFAWETNPNVDFVDPVEWDVQCPGLSDIFAESNHSLYYGLNKF